MPKSKPASHTAAAPLLALAAITICLCCLAGSTHAQSGYEVRNVSFSGNNAFSDDRLSEIVAVHGAGWIKRTLFGKDPYSFDSKTINNDITRLTRFYQRHGYLHVAVTAENREVNHDDRSLSITFTIAENEPVTVSAINYLFTDSSGAPQPTREKLRSSFEPDLAVNVGERFRDDEVQSDRRRIVQTYAHNGYAYITATPQLDVDTVDNSVALTWQIDTGPLCEFGEISVEDNGTIAPSLIRKQMALRPGQRYDRELIDASQHQIYELGVFQIVTVSGRLAKVHDPIIPVHVQLKVAPVWSVRFGGGWGREDGIRALADFQLLDVFGGARRLNLNLKHSGLEPYSVSLTLSQPALFTPHTTGSINPFVRRQEEPGFTVNRWGGHVNLSHRFNRFLTGSITYTLERIELDTATVSDEIVSDDAIDELYNRSSISVAATYDNSRPLFSPSHGWFLGGITRVAGLGFGSQYKYVRPIIDIRHDRPTHGMILALRTKVGLIEAWTANTFIPIEDRLFSGGSSSIRGWARSELGPVDDQGQPVGGNSLLELSSELRYPIYRRLSGVVFFEGGNVWRPTASYRLSDLRYAAGFGLRFATPVGPIRFDLARPVFDDETTLQYHLSVGQAF